MNLATGKMELYAKVTHGKNSGAVLPDSFSNQEGSLQLFAFNGKHGLSLRLVGLEPGKNDKALIRCIVLHADTLCVRHVHAAQLAKRLPAGPQ